MQRATGQRVTVIIRAKCLRTASFLVIPLDCGGAHGLHSLFPALDTVENARYFLPSCSLPRSRFVLDYKGNVGRRQRLCRLRVVRIRRQMPLVAFENRERTRRRRACASSINPSFDRWSRTSYEVPVLSLTMENRPFTEHIWRVGQRYDCKCRDSPIATLLPFHASSSRNNDAGSSHASKSYAYV